MDEVEGVTRRERRRGLSRRIGPAVLRVGSAIEFQGVITEKVDRAGIIINRVTVNAKHRLTH